jgi:hypothetical protein
VTVLEFPKREQPSEMDPEVRSRNNNAIEAALAQVYSTYILDEKAAKLRGEAVQALNRLAERLGFHELVRSD